MEDFFTFPFAVLEIPHMKIKKPSWIKQPSAMFTFSLVLLSYFLVTGGINVLFLHVQEINLKSRIFRYDI